MREQRNTQTNRGNPEEGPLILSQSLNAQGRRFWRSGMGNRVMDKAPGKGQGNDTALFRGA